MAPVLVYWKIRGMGQVIRLLLHYCGEDFEEQFYEVGPAPDYSRESWFSVKYKLGLAFPNLPHYIDGELKLSESKAILRHIGRKHNLLGETDTIKAQVDMLLDVCTDKDFQSYMIFYSPDVESKRAGLVEKCLQDWKLFEAFAAGKTWFTGDKITVADFFLYEHFQRLSAFHPPLLEPFQWIRDFINRFEALPGVKEYIASKDYIKSPFCNPDATWTG